VDEVSIEIDAPPGTVYDLVADVTRMGEWSPETYRCEWLDGCTGLRVDARFKGWNKDSLGPLPLRWSTTCTVRTAARGEEFTFRVRDSGATWTYRMEPDGRGGTILTETRTDGDKPFLAKVFNAVVPNRPTKLVEGMRATLERLKAAAESEARDAA
jgi:hypothetical protein